jgi:4-hydroxybenzoate polyprenyltransferase
MRLALYAKLMRLDRPIGILLLMWPTLWGLWISAQGKPDWTIVAIFLAGTVLMRSAGCVMNDYADRDFDRHVARTKNRPLAAGLVTGAEALVLAAVLALLAFLLIVDLNRLTILLSVVALALAATYPFTKRFFAVPQAYLGIAFGFGIPMAFAAHLGQIPAVAWVMLLANVLWAIAYDTEYAMVDREDDLNIGIKTSALTFGRFDVMAVMVCHGIFLVILALVGVRLKMGFLYFLGLAVAGGLVLHQYQRIKNREPQQCFKAFLHNNWVGASVFLGIAADYWAAS